MTIFSKIKKKVEKVSLFYIFADLFNVGPTRIQLDSEICFCIQSAYIT